MEDAASKPAQTFRIETADTAFALPRWRGALILLLALVVAAGRSPAAT